LHGGNNGFHKKYWEVKGINLKGYASAYQLSMISADGDENYPGYLKAEVIYALNDDNDLLIEFKAVSDKKTIINLTSHPYFNLKGVGGGTVLDHLLEINADYFTPIDQNSIPTGELKAVSGTAMDFTTPVVLSERINCNDQQVKLVGGLDHNWVLNKKEGELALAARVMEPVSGRSVEVFTTQPGLQVYTAMHFDGTTTGKGGHLIMPYSCIALEAQNFPDAPNKPAFPNSILKAGELYHQQIIYRFGWEIK
jgi:aldose 1-epimerase